MLVEQFLNYLKSERNYSVKTLDAYGKDLREFESFFRNLDSHLEWNTLDSDIIRDWMEMMMDKGNIATSVNRRLSALRSFYRFFLSRNLVDVDPAHCVSGPKKKRSLPSFFRESEMDDVLDESRWELGDYDQLRIRTILLLFYSTGIRIAELICLDDDKVDFDASQIKVLGKRNKERIVPFGTDLKDALYNYKSMRDEIILRKSKAFFLTKKGFRLTDALVRKEVKDKLSLVTTLKKHSPHVLRHTFATAMLNHGAGLESVKKILGHESLNATEIYTHTTFEQLKNVYKSAHPRD